jgi:hypothetical protein
MPGGCASGVVLRVLSVYCSTVPGGLGLRVVRLPVGELTIGCDVTKLNILGREFNGNELAI